MLFAARMIAPAARSAVSTPILKLYLIYEEITSELVTILCRLCYTVQGLIDLEFT